MPLYVSLLLLLFRVRVPLYRRANSVVHESSSLSADTYWSQNLAVNHTRCGYENIPFGRAARTCNLLLGLNDDDVRGVKILFFLRWWKKKANLKGTERARSMITLIIRFFNFIFELITMKNWKFRLNSNFKNNFFFVYLACLYALNECIDKSFCLFDLFLFI